MSVLDSGQFSVFVVFAALILALLVAILVVSISSGDR